MGLDAGHHSSPASKISKPEGLFLFLIQNLSVQA